MPSVDSDYTIEKKLANATKAEVTVEDKTSVINALDSPSVTDQTGRGEAYNVQQAFNRPIMRVSQITLEPTKGSGEEASEKSRKTKKLQKLKFKWFWAKVD